MEINGFIDNFANQFEETPREVFTPSTEFRNLDEWSSFLNLGIIAMIDEEYDVQIKGNEIRSANTIQDLFDIVSSK